MEQIVTSVQDTPAVAANEDDDEGEPPLQQVSTKSALEAVETLSVATRELLSPCQWIGQL